MHLSASIRLKTTVQMFYGSLLHVQLSDPACRENICAAFSSILWLLNFVKSNYICQARIVFHNLMLLTVYTYTSYVQIFFIQVRLTEQLPDSSAFLLEF